MVRRDVAAQKIARAQGWLNDAEVILAQPEEVFLADVRSRDLAAFYVFLAVQECIDLAAHWVADAGWGPPDDAASTFDVLADRNAIDRSLADAMRAATGLRNRIAHGYGRLEHRRLYGECREGLRSLRQFLVAVAAASGV